jgi:hypothetical protein
MKNSLLFGKMAVFTAGIVSVARLASADTVQYTYTGETGGGIDMGIQTAGGSGTALVGQFVMTTSNPNYSSTLLTYCTDVGVNLSTTFNYTPTPLASATGVAPAWVAGGIQNAATLWYNDKGAATTAVQTAGLQLAIWELLYNSVASSYTASSFTTSANKGFYITTSNSNITSAESYAASLLDGFKTLGAEQNVIWLDPTAANGATNTGSQGLLYQTPGTTTFTSPDAGSTLTLLGLAATALGMAGRKFSRKQD